MNTRETEKKMAALEAVKEIKDGMLVGLGTGSTAYYAIHAVANLVKEGMKLKAIPTSEQTKKLALELMIPMVNINDIDAIDITIDGADEFTTGLELIKGGGGALLREKIVASLTKNQIIITDSTKMVDKLGKFKVPIEVIPMACKYVLGQLNGMGGLSMVRKNQNQPYITDQGNLIIDADFGLIDEPARLGKQLNEIVGVVEHGIFTKLTTKIITVKDGRLNFFQDQSKSNYL